MAEVREAKQLKERANQIANQLHDLEEQAREHLNVVDVCKDLEASRKCYRLVGGTLVERTIGEVLPTVKEQLSKIEEFSVKLSEELVNTEKKADELVAQAQKNINEGNIKV